MTIEEDIKELIKTASERLKEMEKGIIVLREAGEDITRQEEEFDRVKQRIEGFKRGLKKIE